MHRLPFAARKRCCFSTSLSHNRPRRAHHKSIKSIDNFSYLHWHVIILNECDECARAREIEGGTEIGTEIESTVGDEQAAATFPDYFPQLEQRQKKLRLKQKIKKGKENSFSSLRFVVPAAAFSVRPFVRFLAEVWKAKKLFFSFTALVCV